MEYLASLHPLIVHFPIVLLFSYNVLTIVTYFYNNDKLVFTARFSLFAGILFAILALLTGNQAEELNESLFGRTYHDVIEAHEGMASFMLWFHVAVAVLNYFVIFKKKYNSSIKLILLIATIVGLYLIYQAGSTGGELVFKHGIGTEILK